MDDVERKIIHAIGWSLALFFCSLAWCIFAHADEDIAVYSNGQTAIRGECSKHLYYLTWTETYQEQYYTRSNYYAVCWSDETARLDGNTLTANDLIYYEWTYNRQTLTQSNIDDFTLGQMYGKNDIYSNSDLFMYPSSNQIEPPIIKIYSTWFALLVMLLAFSWGITFTLWVVNGKV